MTQAIETSDTESFPQWTVGDRLKKARERAKVTQTRMGELLADLHDGEPYGHSTIAAWEGDKNQPRQFARLIERWAEITGAPAEWLLTGREFHLRRYLSLATGYDEPWQTSLDDLLVPAPELALA